MKWTGASERTVKYWFAGERGPSGEHLVSLARHSDIALVLLLTMADRLVLDDAAGWAGSPPAERGPCFVFGIGYPDHTRRSEIATPGTSTMTVRVSGALSEDIRDLIRRDKQRVERDAFDRLKAELNRAFAAPEESYKPLTGAEVIARNRT